ncbi:hypothetical protein HYC85_014602 [Camellia sinensis]|uniref:Uncharacterized protein n=1 Tax=Camellia sinensis TaxID=4442 RepID=A0A7J7H7W2_CAMSI|nr:hypothetical protein HYC85_014602 [Camellia sinensis]
MNLGQSQKSEVLKETIVWLLISPLKTQIEHSCWAFLKILRDERKKERKGQVNEK